MRARDLLSSGAPHDGRVRHSATELEEVPMPSIVGGLDIHRKQITFDYADTVTGEVFCGQIAPADRAHLRGWLAGRFEHPEDAAFAVEACTGWRYVTEELTAAGIAVHLAEPADAATQRGKKKRAKTDRADARLQRILLAQGRLPECWIPPGHVLECRALLELYLDLRTEHTAWRQRAHAVLFHQGAPVFCDLSRAEAPAELAAVARGHLSPAGQLQVDACLRMLAVLEAELAAVRRRLLAAARHLRGAGRFSSARKAVRFAGLDITVYSSDSKRSPGHLSRQGPPVLRWAVYEAGKTHARPATSCPSSATTRSP